jgi:hypothetical protein
MYDLLLGGPGETKETLKQTIELMKELSPSRVGAALGVRIVPGTAMANWIRKMGSLENNPNLLGNVRGNEQFFTPIFYVSSELGEDAPGYLASLVAGDERFFFMGPREENEKNYNYNQNTVLEEAIQAGYRGAFWDILRRVEENRENGN